MANQKQYFRIEGEAVHLVSETIQRTVRLSDLLAEVGKEAGVITPILPQGCRFYHSTGERSVFVVEQAPAVRNINWINMGRDNGRWKVAFPYVIFVVEFHGEAVNQPRVFYRPAPLSGLEDLVFSTNLGNMHLNGTMCTGSMRVSGKTQSEKAEGFVSEFWRSTWNTDIQESWNAHRNIQQVSSLEQWERETSMNPLFPLTIQWRQFAKLGDVVARRC